MADEFNASTNWWESSRNRFDSGSSSSATSGLNSSNSSFGWPVTTHHHHHHHQMMDIKPNTAAPTRSSIDSSASVSGSSVVFQDSPKLQQSPPVDSDLQMMGLCLSSPSSLDWNQALLANRGDKSEGSFRSMLQENMNSTSGYRGFSLDHQQQIQFSPHHGGSSSDNTVTCQGLPSSFQMDSSSPVNLYGNVPIFQGGGILGPDNNQNYHYGAAAAASSSYGMNTSELSPSWSAAATNNNNKVPQFLRTSPPKQQQQQLHFSNNAPFWNASAPTSMNDVRSPNFFPSLQTPYATQSFDEKPKHHVSEVRDTTSSAVVKKSSGSEPAPKRAKNDQTASPLPAFKVRKEKMGDRITALQQLVSPFGKTDTASVLSEAIEYIKFLHEQVAVLSTPYMKSGGAPIPHQPNSEKVKESEGPKQDLRSRGLCLVPVSSTFPVTQETTVDFWTPTFGGTFR